MSEPQSPPLPVTTSLEPEFEENQAALYRQVLMALNAHHVPYAVSGAFALHQHTGIWRVTKDLDLFLTSENAPTAVAVLEKRGFHCDVLDPVWLAKAHRDDFFVDLITGMSNAALVVADSWIERARAARVVGVQTRVLAPEELIASKLFVTRRERFDGADIVHIIFGTKGQIDWNRLLELAGAHWELVLWVLVLFRYIYPAHTNYVPGSVWQELLARFSKELNAPDTTARFRGSLIDERMFAIDVNEWALDDLLSEYRDRRSPKLEVVCQP